MFQLVGLGLGAGFVSALLFAAVVTGSPAGMILSYVAPLPILIVALGWHHLLGLLAAAAGAFALSIALRSSAGLAFALGPALPAWGLAYLALLGRATADQSGRPGSSAAGPVAVEWFPIGRLLLWIGVAGSFIALAASIGLGAGDYDQFESTLRRVTETVLRIGSQPPPVTTPPGRGFLPSASVVSLLVFAAPAIAASVFSLTLALNVWAAGKVVSLSGRLPRSWPAIPDTRMHLAALGGLAAGLLLTLGPGFVSVAGRALVGGIGMMFALQGLALLHVATRGRAGRGATLTLAYILAVFFGGTFLPLLAIAGMIDTATRFRQRLALSSDHAGRPKDPPKPPTNLT